MKHYCIIITLLFLWSCEDRICPDDNYSCLKNAVKNHPIKSKKFWETFLQDNPKRAIFIAPDELIEYINLDNRKSGFKEVPKKPKVADNFYRQINDAYAEIPQAVKDKLSDKLFGIFLIKDLGGTGFTEYIVDKDGKPQSAFIILDVDVLKKNSANEWATWKENTPFKSDHEYKLRMKIQEKENDSPKYAIQYILLHEIGHAIAMNENIHPFWNIEPKDIEDLKTFPFNSLSWEIDYKENDYISKFDKSEFPQRKDVLYYQEPPFKSSQMKLIYDQLEETNFVSLYSTINPGDDWAEVFVTYVHTQMLNYPFEITISKDNKLIKTYKSCWNKKRCAKKKEIIENFLDLK